MTVMVVALMNLQKVVQFVLIGKNRIDYDRRQAMSKVEIDKEDFLNLLNQIHKIAENALFNEGFDPHDWGEVENLVEEMTLKLKGLL